MATEHSLHQNNLKEPYVGPRPFEESDEDIFFGRDQEVSELTALVIAHQIVLFYAQSGAGKTSLLKASLLPSLKKRKYEVLPPARVRGRDGGPVEVSRETNIYAYNALEYLSRGSLDPTGRATLTLANFLPARQQLHKRDVPPLRIVVFDQFEELFTLYPERYEDRQRFFEQVRDAVKSDPLLRVIFAMREDYIAELDPYTSILPENLQTRYRLTHLNKERARIAIEKPLEKANLTSTLKRRFAPAAAEKLVNNLRAIHIKTAQGEKEALGPFVEPVQLQVVCQTLWRKLSPSVEVITESDVEQFGNVEKALLEFYEESLRQALAAAQDKNLTEGVLRAWFGRTLITPEGVRGTVFSGRQGEMVGGIPRAVIAELENQRLIRAELRGGETWYELSHDRFIQPIRDANEQWLKRQPLAQKKGEELEARAAEWSRSGKRHGQLLDQAEWHDARRWMASPEGAGVGYSDTLLAYIQASEAAQQKKRVRWMLAGSAVLCLLLLMMGGITVYALTQRDAAKKAEAAARKAEAEAKKLRDEAEDRGREAESSAAEAQEAKVKAQESEQKAQEQANLAGAAAKTAEAQKKLADVARTDAEHQRGLAVAAANQAIAAKSRANALKTLAEGSKLAATSELQREQQPNLLNESVLKALESLALTDEALKSLAMDGDNPSIEGEQALRHGLALLPRQTTRKEAIFASDVAFTSDGTLTVRSGSRVQRFDQAGKSLLPKPLEFDDQVPLHKISPNGEYAASIGKGEAIITNVLEPGKGVKIRFANDLAGDDDLERAEFNHDGSYLAGLGEKTLYIWKTDQEGEPVLTVDRKEKDQDGGVVSKGDIISFAFDRSGDYFALRRVDELVIYSLEEKKVLGRRAMTPADYDSKPDDIPPSTMHVVMGVGASQFATSIYNEVLMQRSDTGGDEWRVILQDKVDQLVLSSESSYLAAVSGNTAVVWDAKFGREVMRVSHEVPIIKLIFSPESNFFATSSADRTVRVWNLSSKTEALRIGAENVVYSFDFSPRGDYLATGGADLRLWDTANNGESLILTSEKSKQRPAGYFLGERHPQSIFYSPGGKYFATLSRNVVSSGSGLSGRVQLTARAVVRIWDAASNREFSVASQDENGAEVNKVVFSPDEKFFVTQTYSNTATVWEIAAGASKPLRKLEHIGSQFFIEEDFEVVSFTLIPKLSYGEDPLSVYLRTQFTPATRELLKNFDKSDPRRAQMMASALKDEFNRLLKGPSLFDEQRFAGVYLSDRARRLLAQNPQGEGLVELNALLLESAYQIEISRIRRLEDVAYSADGKYIATAGRDSSVIIWDARDGNRLLALSHQGRVSKVVFSADGKTLATLEAHPNPDDTSFYIPSIWEVTGGAHPSARLIERGDGYTLDKDLLKFSRRGKYLATSQRIYHIAEMETPPPVSLDASEIKDIDFSPDENVIAVLSAEESESEISLFKVGGGMNSEVYGVKTQGLAERVTFSPDGQHIAAGVGGLLAQVWEVKSLRETTRVTHGGAINTLYFSPGGKYLVTAGDEPTVRLTLLRKDDLIREACLRLQTTVTPEEWVKYLKDKPGVKVCQP